MDATLHPLNITEKLRSDYARYLQTIYPFRDPGLADAFRQALSEPGFLIKGPVLEACPPYKTGRSLRQLIVQGVLHPIFSALDSEALPLDRPLYAHQDHAITHVASLGRNMVVATGTGSGKTETFLVPIFNHLFRQHEAGLLCKPGVRALLLYPMNALANDQLGRLRRILAHFPEITFGRYTGETLQGRSEARERFEHQFPDEVLLPNELLCRDDMQQTPPHILVTNYAMLEYLLLRPSDSAFFDGDTGRFWRFLVLDEAHTYDGAAGIEMALLLRRLKDRVVASAPQRLTCIATSATLGRGPQDYARVAAFASDLFGEPFEWEDGDLACQDVVGPQRESLAQTGSYWGCGSDELYAALDQAATDGASAAQLAEIAVRLGTPSVAVHDALLACSSITGREAINRFLYNLLHGDERIDQLRGKLTSPQILADLAADTTAPALEHLVNLAIRARPNPDSAPLLPARYHVLARALEGAFLCLNERHPAHAQQGQPRLFLARHERCPHCGSVVVEIAACPRCGATYIVGEINHQKRLVQLSGDFAELPRGVSYYLWQGQVCSTDEDEVAAAGDDSESGDETLADEYLCLGCGAIGESRASTLCGCSPETPRIVLQRLVLDHNHLRRCVCCSSMHGGQVIYRLLTGKDAPISVLATSLYQSLPPDREEHIQPLPGGGRKLLSFADSRQDAAFLAPYIEDSYERFLQRAMILKALQADDPARHGSLRADDLVSRMMPLAENAGLFETSSSRDYQRRQVLTWLMREFTALDTRINLEGLGLLHLRLVRPSDWRPPAPLLDAPWQLTPDEAWDLVATLLDSLRQQGVVTFPPNIDPCDEAFAPRNVKLYVRQESIIKQHILGWTPKTDKHSNRRLDYLSRLLQKRASLSASASEARAIARKALSGLWSALTDAQWRLLSVEKLPVIGVVYQTPYNLWEWVPPTENNTPIYRCTRCTAVSYHNLSGVCPTHGCDGELERVDNCPDAWRDNHYRHLYQDMALISLRAEEHTAQWRADDAARIQHQFSAGEVNLLSCSTTFELGVDLGSLNSVLMSNVPPKPANYVQRAGRAGRRSDTAAMVVTFAQRRSHDLYHYAQPMNLIAGAIPPPRIEVRNEKIVRRHVHAVLLAAFFRWARDQHGRLFRSVGSFFHPEEGLPSGPDLLRRYLSQPPDAVRQALRRIVPTDTQRELGIDDWAWLPALLGSQDELGLLDQVDREVNDDLALYAQLKSEAIRKEHFRVAEHLKRIASTVENRDLLGFLGSRNVLPKHGFPTDVVDLHTSHIELSQARQVELQRDLRMAIAEFAPGNQVVAAKYLWRAGGVRLLPGRSLQTFRYAICPECGRFHRAIAAPGGRSDAFPSNCTVCGANLAGREGRHGYYVWPEFGFVAQREPPPSRVGQERPPRLYASRVYFSEYTQEVENPWLTWGDPALDRMWLSYRHSRLGKLSLVNSGIANAGFRLCQTCGWAEPVPVDRRLGSRKHTNPRSGQPCTGMISAYHLGHEFTTDVLELRFGGALTQDAGDATWLSTLYALIEGASRELGIERDDLDGVLYPYQRGLPPALVLYDNVPGGAGHTQHIAESLERVAAAALAVVTNCECGEETSCYGCLRNYYNQFAHDQLERRLARDVLQRLMR